jgi:hypothetical protein
VNLPYRRQQRDRGHETVPRVLLLHFPINHLSHAPIMDILEVAAPADFHVHLRQPPLSALVAPHVREGGFGLAYVMVCPRLHPARGPTEG